jgi:hypothetical protein
MTTSRDPVSDMLFDAAMTEPAYPAARAVVPKVLEHLRRLREEAAHADLAVPLPEAAVLEAAIDAAFWASLRREEGFSPKISLAILPPSAAPHPLQFERPLPLVAAALARLAPAVERPGIHLGIWGEAASLRIWGTMWTVPPRCIVLEVVAPGLLVVKHRRGDESSKFANVAVLEGDQIKVLDQRAPTQPECPKVVTSLFGFESPAAWVDSADVLVQLAVSMREHGRGGALLVVPAGADTWRESIVRPISYAVRPPFSELALLTSADPDPETLARWHERMTRAVSALAGLTAVDGATVISERYELLAFGAKITRRDGYPPVDHLVLSEPVEGVIPTVVHPVQLGGTRHLSAAQFVQDQQQAVALVASQDGRFTVFTWSAAKELVHAHRVETLLL